MWNSQWHSDYAEKHSSGSEGQDAAPSYVYAIGKVVHRFPARSVELELAQATGRNL
jgi:hypothetical protein